MYQQLKNQEDQCKAREANYQPLGQFTSSMDTHDLKNSQKCLDGYKSCNDASMYSKFCKKNYFTMDQHQKGASDTTDRTTIMKPLMTKKIQTTKMRLALQYNGNRQLNATSYQKKSDKQRNKDNRVNQCVPLGCGRISKNSNNLKVQLRTQT